MAAGGAAPVLACRSSRASSNCMAAASDRDRRGQGTTVICLFPAGPAGIARRGGIARLRDSASLERILPDEAATALLGEDLAVALRPGDVLALSGRPRRRQDDAGARVDPGHWPAIPASTFRARPSRWSRSYETRVPVAHFDLYRLSSPAELDELGFDEALSDGAAVDRMAGTGRGPAAGRRRPIDLAHQGDGRLAAISGPGAAFDRVARSLAIRDFLAIGWLERRAARHFTGDASARSYETVRIAGEAAAPADEFAAAGARAAGTRRQALCRDRAYGAVGRGFRGHRPRAAAKAALSSPQIFAQDLDRGFLLIEHLGSEDFLDAARAAGRRALRSRGRTAGGDPWQDMAAPAAKPHRAFSTTCRPSTATR